MKKKTHRERERKKEKPNANFLSVWEHSTAAVMSFSLDMFKCTIYNFEYFQSDLNDVQCARSPI